MCNLTKITGAQSRMLRLLSTVRAHFASHFADTIYALVWHYYYYYFFLIYIFYFVILCIPFYYHITKFFSSIISLSLELRISRALYFALRFNIYQTKQVTPCFLRIHILVNIFVFVCVFFVFVTLKSTILMSNYVQNNKNFDL